MGIGPYYAMFPAAFAERVVLDHTDPGNVVLDPFSGRGTAVFAAAMHERHGIGIEINPVGYVYTERSSGQYTDPPLRIALRTWLPMLGDSERRQMTFPLSSINATHDRPRIPFHGANWLDWRRSRVDCTVMALLLVHLHGKRSDSFSNQMRQTKAMSPPYAIRWWDVRNSDPPDLDPVEFMTKKINWRYAKGCPRLTDSRVFLGDCVSRLGHVTKSLSSLGVKTVRLLLTSPPYCGVTNYHYDQWLRLWLLGGPAGPTVSAGPHQGKFVDRNAYAAMLNSAFTSAARLMDPDGVIYVRTGSRTVTLNATIAALQAAFPKKKMQKSKKPFPSRTQTNLFGGESSDGGEMDIVLS